MKNFILSLSFSFLTFISLGQAAKQQSEMDKLRAEYERMMNDPNHPYGKNKVTGKYYDVRGIKMYAETY